jgi:hypothetical protein
VSELRSTARQFSQKEQNSSGRRQPVGSDGIALDGQIVQSKRTELVCPSSTCPLSRNSARRRIRLAVVNLSAVSEQRSTARQFSEKEQNSSRRRQHVHCLRSIPHGIFQIPFYSRFSSWNWNGIFHVVQ